MNKNFLNMKTNVGNYIQDTSSSTASIIANAINDSYSDFLRRTNYDSLLREYSFSSVAGTKDYVLPRDFGKEVYVFDSTNKINLKRITPTEQVQSYPATFGENGATERYMVLDFPSDLSISSTTITIVSSDNTDTTQTVHIVGLSGGVQLSEDINLNGITNAVGSVTFTSILSISKSATTTGYITITDGSNTLAVMSPKDLDYRAKILRLHDTPDEAKTVEVLYNPKVEPLSDDNDFPMVDASDIIELGATARMWRYKRQFAKAADMEVLFEKGIQNYMFDQENQQGEVHRFGYVAYSRDT